MHPHLSPFYLSLAPHAPLDSHSHRKRKKMSQTPPHSFKKGSLSFFLIGARAAANACVTVSLPAAGANPHVLQALECGAAPASREELDSATILYTAYEVARSKLAGTPLEAMRNKVTGVACGAVDGEFMVSVVCANSGTAIRRVLGVVLKSLNPARLFAKYSVNIRRLGEAPSRECFNFCADAIVRQLRQQTRVTVTGKITSVLGDRTRTARLEEALGKLADKLDPAAVEGAKKHRAAGKKEAAETGAVRLPLGAPFTGAFGGLLAKHYLESNLSSKVLVDSKSVYAPKELAKRVEKLLADKTKAKGHVDKQGRLKDQEDGALAYLAMVECAAAPSAVAKK